MLPTGEQNLSTGSKKYVEVHAFVQKWPLVGSCGEKTRPCDFGYQIEQRYFIHCMAFKWRQVQTCSAKFVRLSVVKGGC